MPDDKALIASSEFDATAYIKGLDDMTAAVTRHIAKEEELKKQLSQSTTALQLNNKAIKDNKDQIAALDKSSADYQQNLAALTDQQKVLNTQNQGLKDGIKQTKTELASVVQSTNQYKDALNNVTAVAKQAKAAGSNMFDVTSLNQQVQQITEMAGDFRDIFQGKIDDTALQDLEAKLASTGDEFERLRQVIDFVESKLGTLDPNSKEFAELTEVVSKGKDVLEQFAGVQDQVDKNSTSLTGRLRALRNQIAQMVVDGKEGTDEFIALQKEAAHLQDAIDKTGERVRTFSNDFRLIQGGIEALRGIAAGFELAEGFSALFGIKNEAVEESIKRLNAIMAIANGLQEVSNLLKKESVVRLVTEEIATKAYTISQRVLAATLGTTAAASRGLAAALAATGIGALVIGIGLLISAISEWSSKTEKQAELQENLNVAIEQGVRDNELFVAGIDEANKKIDEQITIRQIANEKIGKGDRAALRQRIANNAEIRAKDEELLQLQIDQARRFENAQRARGDAAQEQLDRIARGEEEGGEKIIAALKKTVEEVNKATDLRVELETKQEFLLLRNQRDALRDRNELRKLDLQQTEDFLKRVTELQKRLLDAQNKQGRQDAAQIAKTAQDNLNAELNAIDREVRQGKITRTRANALKDVLRQINSVETETELREQGKKAIAAQQSIEDQIFDIRMTAAEQRGELLRDALEREAVNIQIANRKEFNALEVQRAELLKGVQDAFDQGLISEGQARRNTDRIKQIYADLFLNLTEQTRRKAEELARLSFQRSQELVQQLFAPSFVGLTEATTKELAELSRRFVSNRITFEKYQQELTAITRRESLRRIDLQITENEQLLAGVQRRLELENDPKQREQLQAEILRLREEIAQLRRQRVEGEAQQEKQADDITKQRVERVASYAQAIGGIVQSIVSFWAAANEAEQRALERSISLQEQRVSAAQRIAERGNAQYLKLEEDRLNALRVQQENAARRQLAINAVVQASQALVAFTTALAQGINTGGPLGGIAIAAAVLGLLASGYQIIQSLQKQNQSTLRLKRGDRYVRRNHGEPAGDDTIPAMLTEGEAVFPADLNEAYKPVVDAMFDRNIPAEDMNAFVTSYRANRTRIPQPAYQRMGEAAEVSVTYDGRLVEIAEQQAAESRETNQRLGRLEKVLKAHGVNINIDEHGLAVSVANAILHLNKQKRV